MGDVTYRWDMCVDMYVDMGVDMCVGICIDMFTGMFIDMCIDMSTGVCIHMCVDMSGRDGPNAFVLVAEMGPSADRCCLVIF